MTKWESYRLFMDVNGTPFGLETRCPTKTDRQKATTEKKRVKAVAASHGLFCGCMVDEELSDKISSAYPITANRVVCPDPCHGFPSTGYQNVIDKLLDLPMVNLGILQIP